LLVSIEAQRLRWAGWHTITAMVTVTNRMWVMARQAIEVATLHKNDQSVARAINAGESQHSADFCSERLFSTHH